MAAKRMVAMRLDPELLALIDRRAASAKMTRTEWGARALARQALVASSAGPQPGDDPGDSAASPAR